MLVHHLLLFLLLECFWVRLLLGLLVYTASLPLALIEGLPGVLLSLVTASALLADDLLVSSLRALGGSLVDVLISIAGSVLACASGVVADLA